MLTATLFGLTGFGQDSVAHRLRYNPVTELWQPITVSNAPSPRYCMSTVWTGREVIVWGGFGNGASLGDGARYNPASDTWTPVSQKGSLKPRYSHTAVWSGTEMLVWGGAPYQLLNDGAAYNPATDTWRPITTRNAPSPRRGHFALWTGTQMLVWGGTDFPSGGGAYDPVANTWTPITDNIASKPSIDGEPQDQTVAVGRPATLSVIAHGTTPLAYQWIFGTNAISGATNSTYSLTNALVSDSGSYSVVVSNAYGTVTSSVAHLTVQNFPTTVGLQPASQNVGLGQFVQFKVSFGSISWGGTVPKEKLFNYEWRFAGHPIPGQTGASYSITNVQFCDAGEYSVVVTDKRGGPPVTVSAILTIYLGGGQLAVQPQNQVIFFGQPATFKVASLPGLSYQWRIGTNDIPGATGPSYTIPSVHFSDEGVYSVIASSPCHDPATSSTASLFVIQGVPPSASIKPGIETVTVGHRASFNVDVGGSVPLGIQWRFGTNIIPGANSDYYVIDNVQPASAGTYSVVVTNALGSASAAVELIVTPPGALDNWTPVNSGTTNWLGAVAMNRHTAVAVGDSGTIVTSTNGVDWVSQVSGVTNNLNAIVYANGLFVAGGDAGTIVTSPDGIAWTRQRSNTTDAVYGLAFGNGVFVAVGANGLILNSPDGIEWTYHALPPEYLGANTNIDLLKIAFGNGVFIAYYANWFLSLISSNNGADWVVVDTSPANAIWWNAFGSASSLVFDNGYFYCLGDNVFADSGAGFSLASADGANWWGGYFKDGFLSGGATGVGNGQVLVTVTGSSIETADIVKLNADRPIWNDPNDINDPEYYPNDYFTIRGKLPVFLASLGFWHSRFVGVGEAGAIYLSGTLPPYMSQISQSGNATTVRVEGIPLESYVLQSAETIQGPWQSVSTNMTSADGIVTITDPTSSNGGSRFYRVSGP